MFLSTEVRLLISKSINIFLLGPFYVLFLPTLKYTLFQVNTCTTKATKGLIGKLCCVKNNKKVDRSFYSSWKNNKCFFVHRGQTVNFQVNKYIFVKTISCSVPPYPKYTLFQVNNCSTTKATKHS